MAPSAAATSFFGIHNDWGSGPASLVTINRQEIPVVSCYRLEDIDQWLCLSMRPRWMILASRNEDVFFELVSLEYVFFLWSTPDLSRSSRNPCFVVRRCVHDLRANTKR
jgi:hypothetical protein